MSLTVESVYSPSPIEGTPIDGTNEAGVQPTREDVLPGFAGDKTESSEAAVEDIMTTSEVSEDADAFFGEARDVQQAAKFHPSAAVEEATVAEGRPSEVSLGSESTSTAPVIQIDVHSAHGKLADPPPPESPTTKMLQPGIPMPVSADPTVPDPASVHDSPAESPRSPSSRSVVQHALSAVPPSLLSKLSHPSSLSGLFTPYSEASSGPSSPTLQDSIPTLEDEASKGTSTAAADKDGGRGKDEGEMESPIVSPLAASVEAVYNEDHDADLDADGDIDPDYVEGDVEETVIPTTAAILVPPHPDAPADVPIITETLDDPAPTVAAQAEEQAEVVQLVAEAEEMRAIETPAGMGAKELSPAPEDSSAEPLAPKDSAVKEGEWPR
ncbi:uncharacterized protein PHACADRAFT_259804 [Phanerochaete carnosa HHB-10118-sp]|uniref:Uncharacterized protein n=1 Tax=Phanerochaete carnosa (strain HHB-10118-sp) TaxID=650164 RepID=K5W2S6_PHACS|nr:uncharacterized protein PHACADRAFT_259804 [Phanerochaete carnosa HHB-10118-sp]EKM53425.1 hypothetical protein PHACADRAFT_259804 [Phanerochaete carnosa HHB-10118-sp]